MWSKNIPRVFVLFCIFYLPQSHARPLLQADAFEVGDQKAVFDRDNLLLWLDFGISNQEISPYESLSKLDGKYAGWRMPTIHEVAVLFANQFSNRDGAKLLVSSTRIDVNYPSRNAYDDIINLWGVNFDTTTISGYETVSAGFFKDTDSDNWGYLSYSVVGASSGAAFAVGGPGLSDIEMRDFTYFMTGDLFSVLFVKDVDTPEPSAIIMLLIGLAALMLARVRRSSIYNV